MLMVTELLCALLASSLSPMLSILFIFLGIREFSEVGSIVPHALFAEESARIETAVQTHSLALARCSCDRRKEKNDHTISDLTMTKLLRCRS